MKLTYAIYIIFLILVGIIFCIYLNGCMIIEPEGSWLDFQSPENFNTIQAVINYTATQITYKLGDIEKNGNIYAQWPADTLRSGTGNCQAKALLAIGIIEKTMGIECELQLVSTTNDEHVDHAVLYYNGIQYDATTGKISNWEVVHTVEFWAIQSYLNYADNSN